jgi:geranylgeranyl pyrophosphate synthase
VPQPIQLTSASGYDIAHVEHILNEAAKAPGHLGQAAKYLLEQPGKRVRAHLCLDLAQALQLPAKEGITLAATVELLHNASLILDDVQDNDEMRRGRASIWRTFGRNQAINLGTFLIAQAAALAAQLPGISLLFATTLREATAGQSAEIDFHSAPPTLDAYEKIAEAKTGSLFSFAAQSAATLAQLPENLSAAIGKSFSRLGAAYQIQDDLADAFGLKGRSRAGLDLREGKANSIAIFLLNLRPDVAAPLLAFLHDETARIEDKLLDAWLQKLFSSGAVAATQEHLQHLCDDISNTTHIPTAFTTQLAGLAACIREPAVFQRASKSLTNCSSL